MNVSTNLRWCNHFQRRLSISVPSAKVQLERFTTMSGLSLRAVAFTKQIREHLQLLHQILLQVQVPLLQKPKARKRQHLKLRVNCDAVGDRF